MDRRTRSVRTNWKPDGYWIAMVLACFLALAIGVSVASDFGKSWDEEGDSAYGADALSSYRGVGPDWQAYNKRKFYGPAHFMLQALAVDSSEKGGTGWSDTRVRHTLNFLTFAIAVLSFHYIARARVSRPAALGAGLLFLAQPLYIGHAFINGKDIPFMASFLVALALGLASSRAFSKLGIGGSAPGKLNTDRVVDVIWDDWREGAWVLKLSTSLALAGSTLLALGLLLPKGLLAGPLGTAVGEVVVRAYEGRAPSWLTDLFYRVAEDASFTPVEVYVERAKSLVSLWVGALALLLLIVSVAAASRLFRRTLVVLTAGANHVPVRVWVRSRFVVLLLLAAVATGLAGALRVIGPMAGMLVALIFVFEHRSRTILAPLGLYLVVGLTTMVAMWPFLWADPAGRFLEALAFMASHPWRGYVLYAGEVVKGRLLPWTFLPHLMGLQFTEPAILLFIGGCVVLAKNLFRDRGSVLYPLLLAAWLLLPILPVIVRETWLYDNFRQFLFVTPVIFLVAAEAVEAVFGLLRNFAARIVFVTIVLVPGLVAVYELHPYPHVYYNAFVGGVQGAFRRYELDYWATAYQEAAVRLNDALPQGSLVVYWGTTAGAEDVTRSDLTIRSFATDADLEGLAPAAAVILTRANVDRTIMTRTPSIPLVTLDGAVLVVVKSNNPEVLDRITPQAGSSLGSGQFRE